MFTGIIQDIAKISHLKLQDGSHQITFASKLPFHSQAKIGDSIAVNGVCLTITQMDELFFSADIAPSTLLKTALKEFKLGTKVNLEMAMKLQDFIGGHLVQGHVNDTGKVIELKTLNNCYELKVELPEHLMKFCILEGSITIDGVSLTISQILEKQIHINIIPHTWQNTIISNYQIGQLVNVEVDIIAKYMEKWLSPWMKSFKI